MTSISPNTIANYKNITSTQPYNVIDTSILFSPQSQTTNLSPIDQFLSNTDAINTIYINAGSNIRRELGALIVLGYMSAVESYFRALIRRLIHVDIHTKLKAEPMSLSYGAALHHTKHLLPEALLETFSFTGKRNLEETFRDIIGIKGQVPTPVSDALNNFSKICEVRHCCVHRFGKLGATNAIRLGLDRHSNIIETTFSPNMASLQEIADSLRTFVKIINNYIFNEVMHRSARIGNYKQNTHNVIWTFKYPQDRKLFKMYYDIFATTVDVTPSAPALDIYKSFRTEVQQSANTNRPRNGRNQSGNR